MDTQTLLAIQDQNAGWITENPRCSGIGIAENDEGELCLAIYSDGLTMADKDAILARLPDVPVYFEEIGSVVAERL